MTSALTGILLMAYGTPDAQEDIPAYLAHIMGGRQPNPEAVASLARRYKAIGGSSPLTSITISQAHALEQLLNGDLSARHASHDAGQGAGVGYRVYVGMRHAPPFIADTLAQMATDGVEQAIAVALAPHYSQLGSGAYIKAATDELEKLGRPFQLQFVQSWHMQPAYLDALAIRLTEAFASLPAVAPQGLMFTAHSLPSRVMTTGDPYLSQLEETCAAIAARVGRLSYILAFQSAGRSAEPWLGPSMQDALASLHENGIREVVVCPVGFVADHLEILYDIDIALRQQATAMGMTVERTDSLNDSPDFIKALADVVKQTIEAL